MLREVQKSKKSAKTKSLYADIINVVNFDQHDIFGLLLTIFYGIMNEIIGLLII